MSEDMIEAEGQKVVTDKVRRIAHEYSWGSGYSQSNCVYSSKAYPNIVHCNKCDKSAKDNVTSKWKWLVGGSDCAKAIRLGGLSLSTVPSTPANSYIKAYYAQNIVCVVESCQSIVAKSEQNVYCNGKEKAGKHWNCSWFNGIKHTESFHYHK